MTFFSWEWFHPVDKDFVVKARKKNTKMQTQAQVMHTDRAGPHPGYL